MPTLDQKRAAMAWDHGATISALDDEKKKKYASIVYSVPMLVRSAGLAQALHFVQARGDDTQKLMLVHLAAQLHRVNGSITDAMSLLKTVRGANLGEYLQLTQETLSCANWYKRYVQGVLNISASEGRDGAR
jgi:CRISPR-associated protein Cmr5